MRKLRWECGKNYFWRVMEERYWPVCGMTDPPKWAEVAPVTLEGGKESVRCLQWVWEWGWWWSSFMTLFQALGTHRMKTENPLRISFSLYKNICQPFKVTYGLWSKEEAHNIINSLQILMGIWRKWDIFSEAPEGRKRMNGQKLCGGGEWYWVNLTQFRTVVWQGDR